MGLICTWHACDRPAVATQFDKQGRPWANLCTEHAHRLETVVTSSDPRAVMAAWIGAQGGPKAATKRMQPTIDAAARLLTGLQRIQR